MVQCTLFLYGSAFVTCLKNLYILQGHEDTLLCYILTALLFYLLHLDIQFSQIDFCVNGKK